MIPHHVVDGSGDAVVLINSLGATLEMWEPQVGPLSERFRVVRLDTRGHGRTVPEGGDWTVEDFADDVVGLLDHLDIERAHLAGISLGGAIAMTAALRRPERVGRLVLMSTAPKLGTVEGWHARAATVRAEGCEAIADATMARWFTEAFHATYPEVVAAFRERFAAGDREGYATCCEAIALLDLRGRLGAIGAEALVVHGTEDEVTTDVDARSIAAEIGSTRISEIKGAKHLLSTEYSGLVNRLLLEFLAEG